MRTSAFISISSALAMNEYRGPRRFSWYAMAASGWKPCEHDTTVWTVNFKTSKRL
jgi:hypothetical protein